MASYSTAAHGRLHKRGHSGSSVSPPPVPYSPPYSPPLTAEPYPYHHPRKPDSRKVSYEDQLDDSRLGHAPANSFKIKPYLRKMSTKDEIKIDLSRPAAENEGLAGLGIHDLNPSRSASDVNFVPISSTRGGRHNRSTSGNSQFSSTSALQRPSAPYTHPLRATPRPYTPPITKSYTTSVIGSEGSDEATDIMSEDEFRLHQRMFDPTLRSDSVSSIPTAPPPLHIHTSGSLTRLNNPSQSSIPSSMPTGRSRGATLQSLESCGSPSSRPSMDKALGFIRSPRSDEPVDPASRAASIRAARIAYNEREEAKARQAEKEELKRLDRENKRRGKKEERQRRKSDADERRKRARANSSNEKLNDASSFIGKSYNETTPAHIRSLPAHVGAPPTPSAIPTRSPADGFKKKKAARSGWLAFMAWFRTRLLRLGTILHLR
jgi:hypothetical protein